MTRNISQRHAISGQELIVWPYGRLSIWYRGDLNGGGTLMVPWFVSFLRSRYPGRTFRKAFEWCAGTAFIGFGLLEEGICESLCLADINPAAITCVEKTIADNGPRLGDRVTSYVSDNLKSIPETEKFDLVIANPPYAHSGGGVNFSGDGALRSQDSDWKIHADFYASVRKHLAPGAVLCISAFEPLKTEAYLFTGDSRGPWDVRPRPPIEDFQSQIRAGGLTFKEVVHPAEALSWFWIVVSEYEAA